MSQAHTFTVELSFLFFYFHSALRKSLTLSINGLTSKYNYYGTYYDDYSTFVTELYVLLYQIRAIFFPTTNSENVMV